MPSSPITLRWRVASSVRDQALRAAAGDGPELPEEAWRRCRQLQRLSREVRRRGWRHAAAALDQRWRRTIDECRRQLADAADALAEPHRQPASLREIFLDLAALDDEFGGLTVNLRQTELTVRTEPIVLEGLALGQYDIVLDWSRLTARSGAYRIVDAGAVPALVDADVIHPHVRDESLCEGEARPALLAALADGRLLDFFTIVARTLATYNPHSAFVPLDRWLGASCADCGGAMEQTNVCEHCDDELCDQCLVVCQACGQGCCGGCSAVCPACQDYYCFGCLARCGQCQKRYCEGCLTDEHCDDCRPADPEDAETQDARDDASSAAADSLCVGQADPLA